MNAAQPNKWLVSFKAAADHFEMACKAALNRDDEAYQHHLGEFRNIQKGWGK